MKQIHFSKAVSRWSTLVLCLLSFTGLKAQLMEVTDAVTPPFTPENLITNIFLGEGVEVLSVTYSGDPIAVGYFKDGLGAVGLDRGIILTSGRAASSNTNCTGPLGANCVGGQFASNDNASMATDPDLASIASGTLNDVAKYTIVFRPTADTLRFRYVFASEEYPEWACSSFNDVFGFFISGPGITGPFQNNGKNIALIPGTNVPVTINNIHPQNGANCPPAYVQYYNDNNGTQLQPVYDGYLHVFTAEAIVIPCETYTIKLAVADVGDSAYDTGVFLEAKSFGTPSLQVKLETVSLDGTITEGCADGSITFSFPSPVESDFYLDYNIIGTAINGVDYQFVPLDLFIPQGDSSITINIIAIVDSLVEGLETIGFDIQRDICNRDTFWLFIRDNEILPPQLGPDTTICRGTSLDLDGTLPIPLPDPPTFTNQTNYQFSHLAPLYSPIQVAGVQPLTLGPGVIRSVCLNIQHNWADDIDLFLITPGGQFIELSTDNGSNCDNYNNVCFSPTATQSITDFVFTPCPSGMEAPFSNGTFQPEGVWSDLWGGPTNGIWQLLVLDDQAGFNGTLLNWTITFEPLYQIFYRWEPETGLSCADCPDPTATPDTTITYILYAWDTYGCDVSDTITVEITDLLPAPTVFCSMVTNNSITFEWNEVPGAGAYLVSVNGAGITVPNNGPLSHSVTGLNLDSNVTIDVFAIGECNGEVGSATCTTPGCDAPTLTVDNVTNVSCPGDTNGSITISATGGAGDYVFQLDMITNTTGIFTGLGTGLYELSVVDAWGCPNSVQIPILPANPMSLVEIVHPISCFGNNDGSLTVGVTGGEYPYSYIWNGSPGDSLLANSGPGNFHLVVLDAAGCTVETSFTLSEPDELILTVASEDAKCFGANDGSVMLGIAGGTQPHLIQWDAAAGHASDPVIQNLAAGSYSVLVSDIYGCQATATAFISEPTEIVTTILPQNPLCNDSADGAATVTVSGGVDGYSYIWEHGHLGATATSLTASTYIVTVTDGNGCTAVDQVTLSANDPVTLSFQVQDVLCFNGTDGSILTQTTGGAAPYVYLWDNNTTSTDLLNAPAGTYCLTVTDANGCTASLCHDILQPDEILLTTVPTNAGCNGGSEGAILLSVTGGNGQYSFLWDNGLPSQNLNNLTAGSYTVTVTDGNNCQAATTVVISESDAVQVQLSHQDVKCRGGNDGSIATVPTGGAGNFTYNWSGPNGFQSAQQNPAGLVAGNYTVTVQDADGCNAVAFTTVQEPATSVEATIPVPQQICFQATNGLATVEATGGAGAYTFVWSNSQTAQTITGLSAGLYAVTVTDAAGCTDVAQTEVVQQGELVVLLSQNSPACHNGVDGTAAISAVTQSGANVPIGSLNISWSQGGQNTPNVGGLTGGQTYSVTVTNNIGCSATNSITIANPAPIEAAVVSTQAVKCSRGSDGTATVKGIGGTLPYSYQWGTSAGGQTSETGTNLPPGTYVVTVSDANGCTASVQLSIGEPPALAVSFTNGRVLCFGGADGGSFANPSGGTPPYSVAWENGTTGQQVSNLPAGYYSLTLTDANGCILEDSTNILQPAEPVTATYTAEDVSCPGLRDGRIIINAIGGSPPYRYSLNGTDFSGSSTLIALTSNLYNITVKDINGCSILLSDVFVGEPEPLIVDLGPDTMVIYGSHIHIHPFIYNPDTAQTLSYQWYSNNPQTPVTYPDWHIGDFVVTSPTTATLTVKNEKGCTASDMINIFVINIRRVQVPTAFAPNPGGNSMNDLLHVHGSSHMVEKIKLFRVFDRWGELVYELRDFDINDMNVGWDGTFKGKDMPSGVYVWYAEVEYVDGVIETYKGNTTLIR